MNTLRFILVLILVVLVIIHFFSRRFISWKKERELLKNEEKQLSLKRKALVDFLIDNQMEFYSPETILLMDETIKALTQIEEILENWGKKDHQDELKKIKKEAYKNIDDNIGFDLFNLIHVQAENITDVQIKIADFEIQMKVRMLYLRVLTRSSALLLGGMKLEIKERKDFLQKCYDFLDQEVLFCEFLDLVKKKNLLSSSLQRNKYTLGFFDIKELKNIYEPKFAVFESIK